MLQPYWSRWRWIISNEWSHSWHRNWDPMNVVTKPGSPGMCIMNLLLCEICWLTNREFVFPSPLVSVFYGRPPPLSFSITTLLPFALFLSFSSPLLLLTPLFFLILRPSGAVGLFSSACLIHLPSGLFSIPLPCLAPHSLANTPLSFLPMMHVLSMGLFIYVYIILCMVVGFVLCIGYCHCPVQGNFLMFI